LETAGGQRTFRLGERIPLTLSFSSDTPEKYKLNGATYDRSGRLPTEEFVLDRDDVADPSEEYFGTGVMSWLGGGLRTSPVLEAKPSTIEVDLNDWFRFDRAGRYRLYLKSHRLQRAAAPGESRERTIQFAPVSNTIELELIEDATWHITKLAGIRGILEQPEPARRRPGGPPVPYDPLEEKITLAQRELRFLATPEAVELAFEYAHRTGNSPEHLLLVGARNRSHMLSAFDRYLCGSQRWFSRVGPPVTRIVYFPGERPSITSTSAPMAGARRFRLGKTLVGCQSEAETLRKDRTRRGCPVDSCCGPEEP
jgi:hypothetical protein